MAAFANPSRAVFVRNLQSLVEIILTDHAYTKPWSAHPEASKAKPMKTLFLPKTDEKESTKKQEDELIDVCDPELVSNSTIVYDTTKAKTVMSECEKHVTTVTSKRTPDTWEELICR
jgi:regulatory NSL complex subunit 3